MPATLTTVAAILKEIYGPKIVDQLRTEAIGYKRIESTSEGVGTDAVGGKYVKFPIKVKRNQGIGYRNELEQLPTPGQQGYAAVQVPLRYGYGGLKVTGQLLKLAKTNAQAFANAMQEEVDGLKGDLLKDTNHIFYGDGTGALATITAAAVANQITVDSIQYIEVGMQIDIVDTDGATIHASNRQITAINEATKAVTYDGADVIGDAAGDIIVRTGNNRREPNGLGSIVKDTGTLYGVDPTTEPIWKATRNHNSGALRALSESLMITVSDTVRTKGGKTSLILTSLGVRRAYFNLLSQQRRYTDTKNFAGGLTGLAFHNGEEIPVVADPDAPPNKMWFLDEDSFKIYQEGDWDWMDEDGNMLKWVHDYDAYEARMAKYWELGVKKRNANAVLEDLTEG